MISLRPLGLALLGTIAVVHAQPAPGPVSSTYRLTLRGNPVESVLWLYHFSWYGLDRYRLADVRRGEAKIELTAQVLADEVKPHPNVEAYFVALEVPGAGWYRTLEIKPGSLFSDVVSALDALGQVTLTDGVRRLALAPPVPRRIRFEADDGRPARGMSVRVATFGSNKNHCGWHQGFGDSRRLVANRNGDVEFVAPLNPLYVDVDYYVQSQGVARRNLIQLHGVTLDSSPMQVVKRIWDSGRQERFRLHVRDRSGGPAVPAVLFEGLRTDSCGVTWGVLAEADGHGDINASFKPATTALMWLQETSRDALDASERRPLSEQELRTLFREHTLTVIW